MESLRFALECVLPPSEARAIQSATGCLHVTLLFFFLSKTQTLLRKRAVALTPQNAKGGLHAVRASITNDIKVGKASCDTFMYDGIGVLWH